MIFEFRGGKVAVKPRRESTMDTLYEDLDPFFPVAPEKDSDTEESLDYDDTEEKYVTIQH